MELTYKGRPVSRLKKDELIEALNVCYNAWQMKLDRDNMNKVIKGMKNAIDIM